MSTFYVVGLEELRAIYRRGMRDIPSGSEGWSWKRARDLATRGATGSSGLFILRIEPGNDGRESMSYRESGGSATSATVITGFFGPSYVGHMVGGMDAAAQFLHFVRLKPPEVESFVKAHATSVFLNYQFWRRAIPARCAIDEGEHEAVLSDIQRGWQRVSPELPLDGGEILTERLAQAARDDDCARIAALLADGADIDSVDDGTEMTPLTAAIEFEARLAVDYLLANGADPHAPASGGITPLVWAIDVAIEGANRAWDLGAGNVEPGIEIIDRLLRAGADPKRRGRDGLSAEDEARRRGHKAAVQLFARLGGSSARGRR